MIMIILNCFLDVHCAIKNKIIVKHLATEETKFNLKKTSYNCIYKVLNCKNLFVCKFLAREF